MGPPAQPLLRYGGVLVGLLVLSAALAGVGAGDHGSGSPVKVWPGHGNVISQNLSDGNGTSVNVTGIMSGVGILEPQLKTFAASLLSRNVSALPEHAAGLVIDDKRVIVLTNRSVDPGIATVNGTGYVRATDGTITGTTAQKHSNESEEEIPDVIIADSIDVQSEGQRINASTIPENRTAAQGQLFELRAPFRQVGIVHYTSNGPLFATTFGYLAGEQVQNELLRHPGLVAQSVVRRGPYEEAIRRVGTDLIGGIRTRSHEPQFWVDTNVTLDGVVYGERFPHFGPQYPLVPIESGMYVTNKTVHGERVEDFSTIRSNPEPYVGEVVTVSGDVAGNRLSAARVMADPERCDERSRYDNGSELCISFPADVVVHAGVLYEGSPSARADVLPYAAVSNHVLETRRAPQNGTYRITGRIVPIADLDPRLGGEYGLLVYDMEPVTSGNQSRPGDQAIAWGNAVTQAIEWQLNATYEERQAFLSRANAQSTPQAPETLSLTDAEFSDTAVSPGTPITLQATFRNNGSAPEEVTLQVKSEDRVFDTTTVTVPAGGTESVLFQFAIFETGDHRIMINDWSAGTVIVQQSETESTVGAADASGPFWLPDRTSIGIGLLGLFILVTVLMIHRRRG